MKAKVGYIYIAIRFSKVLKCANNYKFPNSFCLIMTTTARLNRELAEMSKSPPAFCSAGPVQGNMHHWQGTIFGPPDSPYKGGVFKVTILFPTNYPLEPPKINFVTRVFHPNVIEDSGYICLDILKNAWKPEITLSKVLLSLCHLLSSPNPDDPLDREKAQMFKNNRALYNQTAAKWTRLYAKP